MVAVLEGGFSGYQAAGYPATAEIPLLRAGHLEPSVQPQMVVDIQQVKNRSQDIVLVDSRDCDRYLGQREPIDPVAGHIPGAVNYPWQAVTDEQGYLKSAQELRQHWADLETSKAWVYCGSGVTACVNLLALEAAGIDSGKLYAGSWSDWCSYPLNQALEAQIV